MVISTRRHSKTVLQLALLSLFAQHLVAQIGDLKDAPEMLDNKPLIQIQTIADSSENEIEDGVRSGKSLNVTSVPLNSVFDDVYEKCFVNLSFPCFQRKMLVYMNKMDRIKGKSRLFLSF